MSDKKGLIILENSFKFKKGNIITEYQEVDNGVVVGKDKDFLPQKSFIQLNESLTPADEKRIKELIKSQLKYVFWQLYTKANFITGG